MGILRDGTGSNFMAKIDSAGNLHVDASTAPRISDQSIRLGNAFVAYTRHDIQAATTNEQCTFFKLNEDIKIFISHIVFSCWGKMKFEMFFDTAQTAGTSTRIPHNLNRSSNKTLDVTVEDGNNNDLTMSGLTAANEFLDVRLGSSGGAGTFLYDFRNSMILGKDDTFGIQVEGGAIGDKARATIYYYKDEETS